MLIRTGVVINHKRADMRIRKAINLLKTQKEIFESESYNNREVWFQKTASLIELFLGRESNEYFAFSNFKFGILTADPDNVDFSAVYKKKRKEMLGLLDNCIDKLNIIGIYKPPQTNILSTYNNWILLTIAVAIFIAGLSSGIWLSENKSFSLFPNFNNSSENYTGSKVELEQNEN